MEKLSRIEKYKELRETIDSDTAAVGKPSINSVELQKQLRSLNEPQESGETSRHSRQTPRFSKEIDLQQNDDADEGPDQFHNEYLDDFINEVKEYNLEKGNRMSGNTQIDILLQLNKGKDRIQTAPPKAAAVPEEDDEGVSYTQSLSSEQLQEEVDRLFEEDEQENEASARVELVEDIQEEQPTQPAPETFVYDGTPLVRINPVPPKEGQPLAESEEEEEPDVQATLNVPVEILEKNKPVEPVPGAAEPATKMIKKDTAPKPEQRPQRKPEKQTVPKKEETKQKEKKVKEKQEKKPSSTSNKVLNVVLLILILALIAVITVTIYWLQQAGGL